MFIYNQIIICQEIIGSQPSVLCTNGKVYQKIYFQLVWLFRSGIMRKNIFVTHNYHAYSIYAKPLNMKHSTKVQTLGGIWRMVYWNIWIENTLHAYVLGEHTSMKNELYIVYRPLLKVRGLSIEPRFSTMCIDLSIHVHVVKD